MTTIAYKAGVMACDSCWSYSGRVDTLQRKIVRLKSGALLGQSGANDARDVLALLQNVKTAAQLPSLEALLSVRADFMGLLVVPSGRIFKIATTFISPDNWDSTMDGEDLGAWEINAPFAAVGSGGDLALVAMDCGKSAVQAVEKACKYDMNTRGPVHTFDLKQATKRKRNARSAR